MVCKSNFCILKSKFYPLNYITLNYILYFHKKLRKPNLISIRSNVFELIKKCSSKIVCIQYQFCSCGSYKE